MLRVQVISNDKPFQLFVVQFLNLLTGSNPEAMDFWDVELRHAITSRFGERALTELEKHNLFNAAAPDVARWVIPRLLKDTGVQVLPATMAAYLCAPKAFKFCTADITSLEARVKHNLSLIDFSEATILSVLARSAQVRVEERRGNVCMVCVLCDTVC